MLCQSSEREGPAAKESFGGGCVVLAIDSLLNKMDIELVKMRNQNVYQRSPENPRGQQLECSNNKYQEVSSLKQKRLFSTRETGRQRLAGICLDLVLGCPANNNNK